MYFDSYDIKTGATSDLGLLLAVLRVLKSLKVPQLVGCVPWVFQWVTIGKLLPSLTFVKCVGILNTKGCRSMINCCHSLKKECKTVK